MLFRSEPKPTYGDDKISQWKEELSKAKEGFDKNYDYSDDNTYWRDQNEKAKLIRHYTKLLKDAGVELDETKEADYGSEYQDMVKRVGDLAKQGPLKTVWDPVKRLYKNVPVEPKKDDKKEGIMSAFNKNPEELRAKYVQAAKDILKGADFDHIARVRQLDVETLRRFMDYAWEIGRAHV